MDKKMKDLKATLSMTFQKLALSSDEIDTIASIYLLHTKLLLGRGIAVDETLSKALMETITYSVTNTILLSSLVCNNCDGESCGN